MDYKNISNTTLQESKNIPAPKEPTRLNVCFWASILLAGFALLCICFIPKAIAEGDGIFIFIFNSLIWGGISIALFKAAKKQYEQKCKDYELSKSNFREYQIEMQLRKEAAERSRQQQIQNARDEYDRQQAAKAQRKADLANGILKCPKCGADRIATVNRGYTITTGFIGSGQAVNVCQVCGHRFKPGT